MKWKDGWKVAAEVFILVLAIIVLAALAYGIGMNLAA